MLNRFGHFFDPGQPESSRSHQGAPGSGGVPDPNWMMQTLNVLQQAELDEHYPLQTTFYETLLRHDLLLPIPPNTNLSSGLPILALENNHGEQGMPVFSSEDTLALWDNENSADYIGLPFAMLCRYALEARVDYIILNVGGPVGCEISSHDFSYLAEGMLPPPVSNLFGQTAGEITIEKNTPMRLSVSQGLSSGVMDRLKTLFNHHHHLIDKVYMFDVAFNQGPLQPALGIRMPQGLEDQWEVELWPTVQAVLHEMLERREMVNVFLLNQTGSMEQHVSELTTPIFETAPKYRQQAM